MAANDFALLVGINRYPGLSSLRAPARDAIRFARWLVQTPGVEVPRANVKLLLSRCFPKRDDAVDAEPNSYAFKRCVNELWLRPRQDDGRIGRRLYLYFSGHGFNDISGHHTALYSAAAHTLDPDPIAATHWADGMWSSGSFEEIVLILDCCRDASVGKLIPPPSFQLGVNPGAAARSKLYRVFATGFAAKAKELKLDDGRFASVFTHLLLEALNHTQADAAGNVRRSNVEDYLETGWTSVLKKYKITAESPKFDPEKAADLVWFQRQDALTRVSFLAAGAADAVNIVVLGGQPYAEVGRAAVAGERAEIDLLPGVYLALREDSGRSAKFQVMGQRIEVKLEQ